MKYLLPIPFNNNNNHVYEQMINKYNTSQCYLIYKSIMNNNFNLLENYNLNNINLSKINIF
jgi:replication fork clamp-binding protein CrfC